MNKQAVIDILREIFRFYGYRTNSSMISDIHAEKDDEHLFVKFEPDPNLNSVRYFSNSVQRYGGKGILISETFDETTIKTALEEGLTLWEKNELESWVGRAVLSGALREKREQISESNSSKPSSEQIPTSLAPEQTKTESERTFRVLLRSLPINIGKSDAISIAETKVGKPKNQALKFNPVWYYTYSCSTQKKFRNRIVDLSGEGEGYIDAITGENFFIKYKDIQDNVMVPTQNYEIKKPVTGKKDALIKAVDAIIRANTKEARLNEMIGDTIVFEHKIFAPDPRDIDLKIELLHIPVWDIRGKREYIEINGYDGHIIGIKVYNDAEVV